MSQKSRNPKAEYHVYYISHYNYEIKTYFESTLHRCRQNSIHFNVFVETQRKIAPLINKSKKVHLFGTVAINKVPPVCLFSYFIRLRTKYLQQINKIYTAENGTMLAAQTTD
jgi:hypothetical protein